MLKRESKMRYNKFDPDDKKKNSRISKKTLNLVLNTTCVVLTFVFIFLVTIWIRSIRTVKYETYEPEKELFTYEDNEEYLGSCIDLFKRIRENRNIHSPPLRVPPKEMKYLFEKNGQMPITSLEYIDEVYKDSNGQASEKIPVITNEDLSLVNDYVEDHENTGHGPKVIKQQMLLYNDSLVDSHVLVLGSEQPWVEMIALNLKASKIITLDYTRKKYENPKLEWFHILDYMDDSIRNKLINHVDFAISYSTIQHAGLGKFFFKEFWSKFSQK
jgi:hypothetical protein